MKLSEMLKKLLKEKEWTSKRLAQKSGVPASTLHGWKNGRGTANFDDLKRIATALEVSVHELVYGEPDPFESHKSEILDEIFSGDVRVTLHRIQRGKK